MKKFYLSILFWGSLWGIAEASVGFGLHKAAVFLPGLPGFLMFPVAFYFMNSVYKSTGKPAAVFLISIITAAFKLFDFVLPSYDAVRIVNPAVSILMEGLAVSLVFKLISPKGKLLRYIQALGMGVAWRMMFAIHLLIISLFGLPAALVTSGIAVAFRFIFVESLVNSLIISAYLWFAERRPACRASGIKPLYACAAFLLAVGLQLIL